MLAMADTHVSETQIKSGQKFFVAAASSSQQAGDARIPSAASPEAQQRMQAYASGQSNTTPMRVQPTSWSSLTSGRLFMLQAALWLGVHSPLQRSPQVRGGMLRMCTPSPTSEDAMSACRSVSLQIRQLATQLAAQPCNVVYRLPCGGCQP